VGPKLNGTHQLLVYADDVNLLEENIDTIKKNSETLTDPSKEVGLKVNAKESKYMLLSHHQNAGQNHNIKTGNGYFENVAQFKYFRTTVTNQNMIQKKIKRRLNSDNICYNSIQNLLPFYLLSENVIVIIFKTVILPLVLYGHKTWYVT
jgi:hypothetical protein